MSNVIAPSSSANACVQLLAGNEKEILAFWDGLRLMSALVPKARGEGFLKVPAGHHVDPRIVALEDATGHSVFGLDGSLDVDLPRAAGEASTRDAWDGFVGALGRLYPYPVRIVDAGEFWARHPVKAAREAAAPNAPR